MKMSLKNKDITKYLYATLALICVFWILSVYEVYMTQTTVAGVTKGTAFFYKSINDFWMGIILGTLCFPLFLIIQTTLKKSAFILLGILFSLFIVLQFSLVKYSLATLLNLGADILGYSYDDIFTTVTVSESLSLTYFLPFIIFPGVFFLSYYVFKKYTSHGFILKTAGSLLVLFGALKLFISGTSIKKFQNKTAYLVTDIVKFQHEKSKLSAFSNQDRNDFPLLASSIHVPDVLSSFIQPGEDKPTIVVIVVEGLGGEFVNGHTFSGFTPFFDELVSKSLYWDNFVSTTGRSFGVLPSLFGSLPYGENGFMELPTIPSHLSLISILKANGYYTSYFSGGASSFDQKVNFLEYNGIDNLIDENKYGTDYVKTESNAGGFSWGYPDSEIFRKALSSLNLEKQPRLDIIMTLSNHEPFEFPDKENYMTQVDELVKNSQRPEALKNQILQHRDIFGSFLYTDNALKDFMEAYAKRPDYNNTIFIITGDHRLIPITQKDKLCRFHVPFLLYSPMLKKAETFKSISSHWDVTPSLLSYLSNNYRMKPIKETPWIGKGLDTVKEFRNVNSIPLMRYKGSISDMIYKEYLFSNDELFTINENFGTHKITDEALIKTISDSLMAFKKMNVYVTQRNKIFPDSLNVYVTPKMEFSEEQMAIINTYANGKTTDELFLIARDLAFSKKYAPAHLLCDYMLTKFPNYTDVRILKGRMLAWNQAYEDSETVLLNALQRSPYYDDAYLAILDMYWWSDQEQKSSAIFNNAIKNELTNADISFKMAKAYQRMEKVDQAHKIMDSIITKHPSNEAYLTFKKSLKL
ncbi:LTA synthase family protein [Flavobacteriaceae bacterium F08102]|nr:LTA synthase family protein [Flavobacteriaceae bacterium F08102]